MPAPPKVAMRRGIDRRVLQCGWAGVLSLDEAEFIQRELAKPENKALRQAWGFSGRTAFPLTEIAAKAFPERPSEARREMRNQMQARAREEKARGEQNEGSVKAKPRLHRPQSMLERQVKLFA